MVVYDAGDLWISEESNAWRSKAGRAPEGKLRCSFFQLPRSEALLLESAEEIR